MPHAAGINGDLRGANARSRGSIAIYATKHAVSYNRRTLVREWNVGHLDTYQTTFET
jgi:hypothetical protein